MVLDLNWKDHPTREEIYGNLPKVSEVVRERCLNFAAHCSRRQNEPVSELVFWMPSQGTRAQGRPRLMYPKLLIQDTGLEPQELLNLMQDSENSSWLPTEVDESNVSRIFCCLDFCPKS